MTSGAVRVMICGRHRLFSLFLDPAGSYYQLCTTGREKDLRLKDVMKWEGDVPFRFVI
jgi:hypothetical protein